MSCHIQTGGLTSGCSHLTAERSCGVLQHTAKAAHGSRVTGLQKLDLCHIIMPNQDLLDQLAGLTRLTALLIGRLVELLPPLLSDSSVMTVL